MMWLLLLLAVGGKAPACFTFSSREKIIPSVVNIFIASVIIPHDGDDVTLTLLIALSLAFRFAENLPPAH